MLKEKCKFILNQVLFSKNPSSEDGSSLIYVLIIAAIGSSMVAISTSRSSNSKSQSDKLKANAFVRSSLMDLNSQLSCPGGAIRVKKGSCDAKSKSITLSIRELRRIAMEKTSHSLATTGGLPAANRGYDYFDLLHMRIVCYKRGSHLDASGKPMMTDKKQIPCTLLGNIDQTLTPLVSQNRLSGVEERFNQDVAVILATINPEINTKIADVEKDIKKLEVKKKVSEHQHGIALDRLNVASNNLTARQDVYNSLLGQFNRSVLDYNAKVATCPSPCPSDSPLLPEIYAAQASMLALQEQLNRSIATLNTATTNFRNVQSEENLARSELQGNIDAIATEQKRISSYQNMIQYLKSISDGKDLILRNSQLAVLQAEGGILKRLLRHGVGGAATSALSRLPNSDNDGLSSSQTTPEDADNIRLGMIVLKPFCSVDNGEPRLRFSAKVTDVEDIGGGLDFKDNYSKRRNQLIKVLNNVGLPAKDGWVKMPINFTPSNCTLIEEEDPPLTGANNWKMDGLTSTRTNP